MAPARRAGIGCAGRGRWRSASAPPNGSDTVGIGHTIQTSVYGVELQTAFDSLEKKLSATYGKGKRTDFLMPDSIWNEPRDWMQSFLNRERYLLKVWSSEHGSTLADSLMSVGLVVGALDVNSGNISIEYSFENIASAEAEISAAEDEAL